MEEHYLLDLELIFPFPDSFRYSFDGREDAYICISDPYGDMDYFSTCCYTYDAWTNTPVFAYFAVSIDEGYMIFNWKNYGSYLVASLDPNRDPAEIFRYFQRFVEVYTTGDESQTDPTEVTTEPTMPPTEPIETVNFQEIVDADNVQVISVFIPEVNKEQQVVYDPNGRILELVGYEWAWHLEDAPYAATIMECFDGWDMNASKIPDAAAGDYFCEVYVQFGDELIMGYCPSGEETQGIGIMNQVAYHLPDAFVQWLDPIVKVSLDALNSRRYDYYASSPDAYRVFVFTGTDPSTTKWPVSTDGCEVGKLYVHEKGKTKSRLVVDGQVRQEYGFWTTKEHIYYVLEDDQTKLYRVEYSGENNTLIYESDYGRIGWFTYWGTDANGQVLMVEGENRAIVLDIPTGEITVLMEQYYIESFLYYEEYTIHETHCGVEGGLEIGPALDWIGKVSESDDMGNYTYDLDTGDNWHTPRL